MNVYNASIRRGDCWDLAVTWLPDGETVDMTGYTSEFVVSWPRQATGNGTITAGSIEVTPTIDVGTSTVTVAMEPSDTLAIPAVSTATYQMRVTDLTGCKLTIATGVVTVLPSYLDA